MPLESAACGRERRRWSVNRYFPVFAAASYLVLHVVSLPAQGCDEITKIAEMARARSVPKLTEASKDAGDSYRARLVFGYRSFQLNRESKANAHRLLALIPTDDAQQSVVLGLGDSLCDDESIADMSTLARVNEGFARELARAVLLARNFLPSYVNYSMVAVLDPHSEYALQMRRVCRQAHTDFLRAVKQLPEGRQGEFIKHVMDPNSCRVLAVPEAER